MRIGVMHRSADGVAFAVADLVLYRRAAVAVVQRTNAAGAVFLVTQRARIRVRRLDRFFLFPVDVLGDRIDRRAAPEYLCFFFR